MSARQSLLCVGVEAKLCAYAQLISINCLREWSFDIALRKRVETLIEQNTTDANL